MEELKISFKKNIRQYIMLLALAGIWLVFAAACGPIFVSPSNLSTLFLQTVTVAIVACGMTLVIVTGNIDLSVGSVAGFAGAVAAVLQVRYGWGSAGALLAAIAAGLAVGAWHGFWVAYRKVPAFIVTLASMLAFRGLILGVTGGSTVAPLSARVMRQTMASSKSLRPETNQLRVASRAMMGSRAEWGMQRLMVPEPDPRVISKLTTTTAS